MEYNFIDDGINAVVIDNFYTEDQLKDIMLELKFLTRKEILVGEEKLNTAENEHGALASKSGVFLETVFANWKYSTLISHALTQMSREDFKYELIKYNPLYKILFWCNNRDHLLSYYENSQYYKSHTDSCTFTILNYFHTEPKKFDGGEVILHSFTGDKKATVEIKNNRTIVMTGGTYHEVNEIKSSCEKYDGDGRYCNAIFMNRIDDREWKNAPHSDEYARRKVT